MLTREQLEADICYLARRAQRAGAWSSQRDRDWGVSSNSLVSLAYGVGTLEMPRDWDDYTACVRAVRRMPRHRRTWDVMIALIVQKHAVEQRHPAAERRSYGRKAKRRATFEPAG